LRALRRLPLFDKIAIILNGEIPMFRSLLALSLISLTSSAFAEPFTLTCNVTSHDVFKTGQGSSARWKNENTETSIDKVVIDVDANTWTANGRESPSDMAAVTDSEYVLIDFAHQNGKNSFRINRRTGAYTIDSVFYDSYKNETQEGSARGSCKKDAIGPQKF
jgi:hypothetical protein